MRTFYIYLLLSLVLLSSRSAAWELQQFTTCDHVAIKLDAYSMCIPDDYFFDRINDNRIVLISKGREEVIAFHNSNYARYKNKSIDDVMIFKKSIIKNGYEIYVHQLNESIEPKNVVYTWSIPLQGDDFILVITGFSEKNIEVLFGEVIASMKKK